MPFVRGKWNRTELEPVALLGFLGSALVSKERDWKELGGEFYDDVIIFTRVDSPLNGVVSNRQSSSSKCDVLPPARGRVGY